MDRRIGVSSAVMRALLRSVVVKRELSRKEKLSGYCSSLFQPSPVLTDLGSDPKNEVVDTSG